MPSSVFRDLQSNIVPFTASVQMPLLAGPYQMFGELVDVVLFSAGELLYLEELPVAYAQQHWRDQPRGLAVWESTFRVSH